MAHGLTNSCLRGDGAVCVCVGGGGGGGGTAVNVVIAWWTCDSVGNAVPWLSVIYRK